MDPLRLTMQKTHGQTSAHIYTHTYTHCLDALYTHTHEHGKKRTYAPVRSFVSVRTILDTGDALFLRFFCLFCKTSLFTFVLIQPNAGKDALNTLPVGFVCVFASDTCLTPVVCAIDGVLLLLLLRLVSRWFRAQGFVSFVLRYGMMLRAVHPGHRSLPGTQYTGRAIGLCGKIVHFSLHYTPAVNNRARLFTLSALTVATRLQSTVVAHGDICANIANDIFVSLLYFCM